MTLFGVRHATTYEYHRPVRFREHRLLFRPRDSPDQRLLQADLLVEPEACTLRWIHDVFGNCVALITPSAAARRLRFETLILLEHTPLAGPSLEIDARALAYPFAYPEEEAADLAPYVRRHHPDAEVDAWARRFLGAGRQIETGHLLMTLCFAIRESFRYSRRYGKGAQPPALTLRLRRGACRDFALLMMEAVRSLGFAARFVTGYVYVAGRDGSADRGGGSTHAWCQVYLPGAGWAEFDPTNGIVGSRDLIRIAVARTPEQAIPLSGSYEGAAADYAGMTVQVNVTIESQRQAPDSAPSAP